MLYSRGVTVSCEGHCIDGDVRLEDGAREYEGRIEVCYNGEWGTVCDDDIDDSVAEKLCVGNSDFYCMV